MTRGSIQFSGKLSVTSHMTFHLRDWRPWQPERWGSCRDFFHYEPTLVLFNATKFWMLVENTVKVMVWKDFDVLQKPDFPLICMKSLCSIVLRRWIFVPVGYNSRHNLWVMGNVGQNMDLEEKGEELLWTKLAMEIHKYEAKNISTDLSALFSQEWLTDTFADLQVENFWFLQNIQLSDYRFQTVFSSHGNFYIFTS